MRPSKDDGVQISSSGLGAHASINSTCPPDHDARGQTQHDSESSLSAAELDGTPLAPTSTVRQAPTVSYPSDSKEIGGASVVEANITSDEAGILKREASRDRIATPHDKVQQTTPRSNGRTPSKHDHYLTTSSVSESLEFSSIRVSYLRMQAATAGEDHD